MLNPKGETVVTNKAGKPNTTAYVAGNASPASAARRRSPFIPFFMETEFYGSMGAVAPGPCEIACGECLMCRFYDRAAAQGGAAAKPS